CVSRFSVRRHKDDPRPGKAEAVLDLMRAFATLPANAVLLLVGDGDGRAQIEGEAARLKISRRVRLAGEVEHSNVSWYYAACVFCGIPDLWDNYGAYEELSEDGECR